MTFLRTLFVGSIAAATIFQPSAAQATEADPSLVWQFTHFKDAANKNIDTAQLIYGIPETDAVVAMASCNAGNAGKVNLSLSANVSVPDKSKVTVKLFGQLIDGSAIIPESGEGLTGFSLTVLAHDPLLAKLASKPSLTYGLKDGPERTIPLSKGKSPIRNFVQACKSFAALKHASKAKHE